jgi:fructose-1,6-bisphosphatase/inositol monophosphatase family enzyme
MNIYRDVAIDIAQNAGNIMRRYFAIGMASDWKKDNSPVTIADREINAMVIKRIKECFPKHGIKGEEISDYNIGDEYLWVCDPIDGTVPYSHGIPTSVFSIALVKNGKSILGIVYDPFMDRMFFAQEGKGAFMNNKQISVRVREDDARKVVGCEWWINAPFQFSNLFENLSQNNFIVSVPVCIIYSAMMVAVGEFVGAIFCGSGAHDIAAVKIIVEEAGGKVTNLFNDEQLYNQKIRGAIISNNTAHNDLVNIVKISRE